MMYIANAVFLSIFEQNFPYYLEVNHSYLFKNNIMLTLFCGVAGIALFDLQKPKRWMNIGAKIAAVALFVCGLSVEWGRTLIPFMIIQRYCKKPNIEFLLICGLLVLTILLNAEPFFFLVYIFIYLYNGERGPNSKWAKYMFYLFYPLHLWIIMLINMLILQL